MFVCFVKYSTVVNMIYSKQLVLSYLYRVKMHCPNKVSVCVSVVCQPVCQFIHLFQSFICLCPCFFMYSYTLTANMSVFVCLSICYMPIHLSVCLLCCLSLMFSVPYVVCLLCCLSLMLSISYVVCFLCFLSLPYSHPLTIATE